MANSVFWDMQVKEYLSDINSQVVYRNIINSLDEGILIVKFLAGDDNKVYNAIILEANDSIQKHTGFDSKKVIGKYASDIFPVLREPWIIRFNEIVSAAAPMRFEEYSQTLHKWLEVKTFPTDQKYIFGILVTDITLRKQYEQLLAEDAHRGSNVTLTGMAHCKIIVDENGEPFDYKILTVNNNYAQIIGIRKEDIEGKMAREVFPGIENFAFNYIKEYGKVALEGIELNSEAFFEPTKQYISMHAFSLVRSEFIVVFTDISVSKRIETSNRVHKELLQTILNSIPVMITIYEPRGTNMIVNKEFEKITGWTQEEINQGNIFRMIFSDPEYLKKVSVLSHNETGWQDITMTLKDGSKIQSSWANIKIPGGRLVGIGIDIMERKKAEETLQRSLLEKEFLMKEVHHRVKNNLQVIASLLRLQMDTLENEDLKNILLEGSNRVRTIAMIHEKLYGGNLEIVKSTDYIPELVTLIQSSYKWDNLNIKVDLQIAPLEFKIDNAVYLGLLINEILSNSFKHAFRNRDSGEIKIILRPYAQDKFELSLSDNGVGFNANKKNGLGLVLIQTMVEQLEGTSQVKKTNGVEYNFIIKK